MEIAVPVIEVAKRIDFREQGHTSVCFVRECLAEPAKSLWGFGLECLNESLILVLQGAAGVVGPNDIEECLQLSALILKAFSSDRCGKFVVPVRGFDLSAAKYAKKRRFGRQAIQSKQPTLQKARKALGTRLYTVRPLDGRNDPRWTRSV